MVDQSAQLERLRTRFVAGLARRRSDIVEAATVADAISAAHKLAGAAGSYGYPVLGELARAVELALRQGHAESEVLKARLHEEIERLIQA